MQILWNILFPSKQMVFSCLKIVWFVFSCATSFATQTELVPKRLGKSILEPLTHHWRLKPRFPFVFVGFKHSISRCVQQCLRWFVDWPRFCGCFLPTSQPRFPLGRFYRWTEARSSGWHILLWLGMLPLPRRDLGWAASYQKLVVSGGKESTEAFWYQMFRHSLGIPRYIASSEKKVN